MNTRTRHRPHGFVIDTKPYAMRRMALALARAVGARLPAAKDRAARWAAAWGLLAGISGKGVRLKYGEAPSPRSGERRRWRR
jgi:hypothetical protein